MSNQWDGFGVQGLYICVSAMVMFTGSAAILFFYFWRKERLGMDEEAKHQMMKEDQDYEGR